MLIVSKVNMDDRSRWVGSWLTYNRPPPILPEGLQEKNDDKWVERDDVQALLYIKGGTEATLSCNKVDCKGSATTKMMIWCSKPIPIENIELARPVSTTLRGFECESAQNSNMHRIEYLVPISNSKSISTCVCNSVARSGRADEPRSS